MAVAKSRADTKGGRPRAASRYDRRTSSARMPADGLARPPKSRNVNTVTASVVDPWGDGVERHQMTVNRAVDILELERSHGRISEAAYPTGRQLQAVFEKIGAVGGTNWQGTSRVDVMMQQELRVMTSLDHARFVTATFERMRARLGMIDARLLRRILGERMGFPEAAALQGKAGERGTAYIAGRFRDALEDLAEAWSAKGKASPAPVDKHSAEWDRRAAAERAALAERDAQSTTD